METGGGRGIVRKMRNNLDSGRGKCYTDTVMFLQRGMSDINIEKFTK